MVRNFVVAVLIISQEHMSGRSAWQNMWVGFGGRITLNLRSHVILPPNPTHMFWQTDLPQTCSWFYLMLLCYLRVKKYYKVQYPPYPLCLGCSTWAVANIWILMLHFPTLQGNITTLSSVRQRSYLVYRPLRNNILLLYICNKIAIRNWHCLPWTGGVWLWPTYGNGFYKWLRTIGRTNRYSGQANSWGSKSFECLKNKYLHILFYTKIDFIKKTFILC